MIIDSYIFNPTARTIQFQMPVVLSRFATITNTDTNVIIYQFNDSTKGGVVSGNTLLLDYDTSSMSALANLQIIYSNALALSDAAKEINDLQTFLDTNDASITSWGDKAILSQVEREDSNYDTLSPLLVHDYNLDRVLGSQPLTNAGRLKVEGAIQPEVIIQGVMGSLNQEVKINLTGQGSVTLQLVGTWAGTMTFYGSIDGQNWYAIYGQIPGTAIGLALNTTANGLFRFHTAGLLAFKVQFTAYTSGAARAILVSTPIGALNSHVFVTGSQTQLVQQKATTFEALTYDNSTAPSSGIIKDVLTSPDWNSNAKGYFIGDTVSYLGQIYQCIAATGATAANILPTNTTYWQIDQRQNKSVITTQYLSPSNAARVRVEIDLDGYQYRLAESQMLNQQIQMQNDMIFDDYQLSIMQDQGGQYGKKYALGISGMAVYNYTEVR